MRQQSATTFTISTERKIINFSAFPLAQDRTENKQLIMQQELFRAHKQTLPSHQDTERTT